MAKKDKKALTEEPMTENFDTAAPENDGTTVESAVGGYLDAQESIKKFGQTALWLKVGGIIFAALLGMLFLLYVFLNMDNSKGSFTVQLTGLSQAKGVMISETAGFANPNVQLSASPVPSAWNITYKDIPEDIDTIDGSNNSEDYLAYTFYIKNTGEETLDYATTMRLDQSELGAEHAIRIMVIENFRGERKQTIYAKPAKATGAVEAFAADESFTGDVNLFNFKTAGIAPGEFAKYTVVVWYEGNDPECVNDILGGTVKMTMLFDIPTAEE